MSKASGPKATGPSHVGLLTPRSPGIGGSHAGAHRNGFGGSDMNRILIAVALAAAQAHAEETTTVFGIALGKPLELADCASSVVAGMKLYDSVQRVHCREDARADRDRVEGVSWSRVQFPAAEAPLIAKWAYVNAYIIADVVEGIEFPTAGVSSQEVVLAQLSEKFGRPTTINSIPKQNAMGASFKVYEAEWRLPTMTVSFSGALDAIDKGRVEICRPRLCAARATAAAAQGEVRTRL